MAAGKPQDGQAPPGGRLGGGGEGAGPSGGGGGAKPFLGVRAPLLSSGTRSWGTGGVSSAGPRPQAGSGTRGTVRAGEGRAAARTPGGPDGAWERALSPGRTGHLQQRPSTLVDLLFGQCHRAGGRDHLNSSET